MKQLEQYYRDEYDNWVGRMRARGVTEWDAEDIVQEAFTVALTYYHTFNPKLSSFPTWFTRIVNQTQRKMKRDALATVEIQEEDIFTDEADQYEGDKRAAKQVITDIGDVKKETHRNVLWLHLAANMKVGEVSKQLQMPVETVKTIVKRFTKKVREKYG